MAEGTRLQTAFREIEAGIQQADLKIEQTNARLDQAIIEFKEGFKDLSVQIQQVINQLQGTSASTPSNSSPNVNMQGNASVIPPNPSSNATLPSHYCYQAPAMQLSEWLVKQELKDMKQHGSVENYINSFESITSKRILSEDFKLQWFLNGLKEDIAAVVRLFDLSTLQEAVNLAKFQERVIEMTKSMNQELEEERKKSPMENELKEEANVDQENQEFEVQEVQIEKICSAEEKVVKEDLEIIMEKSDNDIFGGEILVEVQKNEDELKEVHLSSKDISFQIQLYGNQSLLLEVHKFLLCFREAVFTNIDACKELSASTLTPFEPYATIINEFKIYHFAEKIMVLGDKKLRQEAHKILEKVIVIIWNWFYKELYDSFNGEMKNLIHSGMWIKVWKVAWILEDKDRFKGEELIRSIS